MTDKENSECRETFVKGKEFLEMYNKVSHFARVGLPQPGIT